MESWHSPPAHANGSYRDWVHSRPFRASVSSLRAQQPPATDIRTNAGPRRKAAPKRRMCRRAVRLSEAALTTVWHRTFKFDIVNANGCKIVFSDRLDGPLGYRAR